MLNFENEGRCRLSTPMALPLQIVQGHRIRLCRVNVSLGLAAAGLVCLGLSGCGGAPPAKQTEAAPAKPVKAERVASDERSADKSNSKKKDSGIPFDAFFDNPLEVASNTATVGGGSGGAVPKEAEKPEEKTMSEKPAPSGGGGALAWSDFVTSDAVQDEVKKVRNRLTGHLSGQGTYNGNYKDISVDGAVLAALAGIMTEHSGDVPWKANAPYVRNFGLELSQAATGLGKDNFDKSKNAFDKLQAVFRGEIPADAQKPAPKRPFHEVADRGELMKRIEKAKNWMRDNINNDAKLKGETEAILHEAAMIATLGKVVTQEGYGSTDEEEYKNFAKALIDGGQEAAAAAKDQSLKKFTDAMNKVSKSCDQCHANYATG